MAAPIFPYRTSVIGQSALPTNELAVLASISGTALGKAWPSDTTGTTQTANNAQFCGFRIGFFGQYEPILYQALPTWRVRRGSRVLGWTLMVGVVGSAFPSNILPTDPVTIKIWAIRRSLSSTLSGVTWSNYVAGGGNTWDQLGILFGIGGDVDPVEVGQFTWGQQDHNLNPSLSNVVFKAVELREEAQFLFDQGKPFQLAFQPTWARPVSGDSMITISQPSGSASTQHSFHIGKTRENLEYFAIVGTQLDRLHMLAAEAAGRFQHMYLGTPSRGASSPAFVWGLANEKEAAQVACCTVSDAMVQIGPVDHTGVAGDGWMRTLRGFDTATGQTNRTCTIKVEFTSNDDYVLSYQDEGTTGFVTTGLTDSGVGTTATTKTFKIGANDFVTVLSVTDGNFGGTFADDDVLLVEMRADGSDSEHPASSLDDVRLAPHAATLRLTADTVKARPARVATVQQAFRFDTVEIDSAVDDADAPTTIIGVIARVDHGDGIRVHVKVSDPERFVVDQWITIAHYNAKDESTPGLRVLHGHIKTIYALDHGTWPGQIELHEDATGVTTDFPNEATVVCSGVWHGELAAAARGFLAAPTSPFSNRWSLAQPLPRPTGSPRITNPATGESETRTIDHLESTDVVLTAPPSRVYPIDSEITFDDDFPNWNPVFVFASPGASATIERKQGFVAGMSFAIV